MLPSSIITLNDDISRLKSGRIYLDDFSAHTGTPLFKIRHINDEQSIELLSSLEPDWIVIIGWSQIASEQVLAIPKYGCIGAHPTLLPQGRGRASIPWAILKGLEYTGVTLFKLDKGVDTGPIVGQHRIRLTHDESATSLYTKVSKAHQSLVVEYWPRIKENKVKLFRQDSNLATYWPARRPNDGLIDPSMSAAEIDLLVRATTRPYPGAYYQDTQYRVTIWRGNLKKPSEADSFFTIHCSDGNYYATDYEINRLSPETTT